MAVLAIAIRNPLNVLRSLIVVLVFVAALNQVLLCLLEAKRTHEAISITRDVDVGHVATGISRSPVVAVSTHHRASYARQDGLTLLDNCIVVVTFVNWSIPRFVPFGG